MPPAALGPRLPVAAMRRAVGRLPPVALGDRAQLVGTALASVLGCPSETGRRADGAARAVRSSGELTGVDLTFRVAVATGIAVVEGRRVRTGEGAGLLREDPLEALYL